MSDRNISDDPKTWQKLPAVEGSVACFTCGAGARSDLPMERPICVGFGAAGYTKDGQCVWDEGMSPTIDDPDDAPTVGDVEKLALADPDHDWRIYFEAPLYSAEYQRQAEGVWVLVRKGEGFA